MYCVNARDERDLRELVVAVAVKKFVLRRPGEKVEESLALMANDGGRIRLRLMVEACSMLRYELIDVVFC